jgi:hypothetical protein
MQIIPHAALHLIIEMSETSQSKLELQFLVFAKKRRRRTSARQ